MRRATGTATRLMANCRASQHRSIMTKSRSYDDAIEALNTLQTPFALLQARHKAGIKPDASFVHEMRVCLRRIGYTPADLNRLNIVHVAGTKGKGSTCAYVDSILSQYRQTHGSPRKTGLFISPHLIAVRERMRINSQPVSKDLFARYFFDVWDRLAAENHATSADDGAVAAGTRPTYARFLTLMSWHLFLQEGVDVAVYETGIGGEFDATNLVEKPVASGVTSLGIDHVFALGDTLEKISWHKAGIMKTGSPTYTIRQRPEAATVLQARADEKDVTLTTLETDTRLEGVRIRPDTDFQKANATLAIALAEEALRNQNILEKGAEKSLPKEFIDGLENMRFRGRCEVKNENNIKWCLDGAHTADSVKVAMQWFMDEVPKATGPRVLIFNQQGRTEARDFLKSIYEASQTSPFTHVIFTTNLTTPSPPSANSDTTSTGKKQDFVNNQFDPEELKALTVQRGFAEAWAEFDPQGANVSLAPSVDKALESARAVAVGQKGEGQVGVLVTGSLHLVGATLGTLEDADAL